MKFYSLLGAVCLFLAFHYALRFGSDAVQRRAGRAIQPGTFSIRGEVVFFGLFLAIAMPPVFLLPNAHWLVYAAFFIVGSLISILVSQTLFGRKIA